LVNKIFIQAIVNTDRSEPKIKGNKPVKRRFHTATTCGDKMFVFGGCNGNYKCLEYKSFLNWNNDD